VSQRTHVFISYSHDDQTYLDRLMPFLRFYEYHTPLELWSDQRLKAGDDWEEEIANALEHSTVALLLISSSFLSS